tara:strand:+ start:361 stop:606 length:246 start_codon:yes stop_codon:yes gene_type:complete
MKRLLLPLLAALALPNSVNAESTWLILRWRFFDAGGLEKIEMEDMEQCELMGTKWTAAKLSPIEKRNPITLVFGYECLEGK